MGRKNRIYPKDWLIYKPYTVPDQVDRYYVGLANEVMNLLENSELSGFFSGHPALIVFCDVVRGYMLGSGHMEDGQ